MRALAAALLIVAACDPCRPPDGPLVVEGVPDDDADEVIALATAKCGPFHGTLTWSEASVPCPTGVCSGSFTAACEGGKMVERIAVRKARYGGAWYSSLAHEWCHAACGVGEDGARACAREINAVGWERR